MIKDMKIVEAIKNGDKDRKEFFLNKLRNDLKKYALYPDEEELEVIFLKEIDSYTADTKQSFYHYCFGKVKERLNQRNTTTYPVNPFFRECEMILLNYYLDCGKKISTDELAKKFGTSAFDVSQIIYRLKELVKKKPEEVKRLFPNYSKKNIETEVTQRRKTKVSLNKEDLELIGYYTGQIDDLCLEVSELAAKYNTTSYFIEYRLKKIYSMLSKEKNFNIVLQTYPEIIDLLLIRGKPLGFETHSFLPESYRKSIHQKKEKNSVLKKTNSASPTTSHKKKGGTNIKNKQSMKKSKSERYASFLQTLYQKDENGQYYSYAASSKRLNMSLASLQQKRKRILSLMEEDEKLKKAILSFYPTLLEDMSLYEDDPSMKKQNRTRKTTTILEDVALLQQIYQTKVEGRGLPYQFFADYEGVIYNTFMARLKKIFTKLENDEEYRYKICQQYPSVLEDKRTYDSIPKYDPNKHFSDVDFPSYVKTLKLFYHSKEDGTHYSLQEIAKQLDMSEEQLLLARDDMLKKLEENSDISKILLELYPTFLEDKNAREEDKNTQESTEKESDCQQIDDTVDTSLDILSEREQFIADSLYQNVTRKVKSYTSLAKKLEISPSSLTICKGQTLAKIQNHPDLQKRYPTFAVEAEIRNQYRTANSLSLSKEELENIKAKAVQLNGIEDDSTNAKKNTRDHFLMGIHKLENSKYKEYIRSCTGEQKAMLALRLGYFDRTIFSSKDIADFFGVDSEEVDFLTDQCLAFESISSNQEISSSEEISLADPEVDVPDEVLGTLETSDDRPKEEVLFSKKKKKTKKEKEKKEKTLYDELPVEYQEIARKIQTHYYVKMNQYAPTHLNDFAKQRYYIKCFDILEDTLESKMTKESFDKLLFIMRTEGYSNAIQKNTTDSILSSRKQSLVKQKN